MRVFSSAKDQQLGPGRVVCLSNVFDHNYEELRREKIPQSLSANKRRDLFRCVQLATAREIVILSAPPKALERRRSRWLPETETLFDVHRQLFCPNWDMPKLRIPFSWFFYTFHVLRHTRRGDLVLVDNYEIIYVIAAWTTRFWRKVNFVLDYEDGKHLIDRGVFRVLSAVAELLGRPLFRAALVAHPTLSSRLRPGIPRELVPGFVTPGSGRPPARPGVLRLLYSGSLDPPRGIDLLLQALPMLPDTGWTLEISGAGPLARLVCDVASQARWRSKVNFHGTMSDKDFRDLVSTCHIGLNCQKCSDPISSVTFPSKIFTYLSAGLLVISSRASQVEAICQAACLYYDEDTPEAIAFLMRRVIENYDIAIRKVDIQQIRSRYSIPFTAARLTSLLTEAKLL